MTLNSAGTVPNTSAVFVNGGTLALDDNASNYNLGNRLNSAAQLTFNSGTFNVTGNSNTGYTSEKYVTFFNTASSEPDAAKRKAIYAQTNDLLLDESFVMSISSSPARMVTSAKVHDIGLSQHGAFLYNSAWIDT